MLILRQSFQKNSSQRFMNKPIKRGAFHAYKYNYDVSYGYRKFPQMKPKSKWKWVPKSKPLEPEIIVGSNANFFVDKQMNFGHQKLKIYNWKDEIVFHHSK